MWYSRNHESIKMQLNTSISKNIIMQVGIYLHKTSDE